MKVIKMANVALLIAIYIKKTNLKNVTNDDVSFDIVKTTYL